MRPLLLLPFVLLSGAFFAGCLQGGAPEASLTRVEARIGSDEILQSLHRIPPLPPTDGMAAVDRWERFIYDYPKRDWRLPHNDRAAEFLHQELESAGFESALLTLPTKTQVVAAGPASLALDGTAKAVRGTRLGVNPDHRIALVAHYDTEGTTTMGAYDDASGTMLQLELCKSFSRVATNHTIECLFFDGEEEGFLASRAYVDAYKRGAFGNFSYDLVIGFDMTGINWPGYDAWKLYVMIGTQTRNFPDLDELTEPLHSFLDVTLGTFVDERVQEGAADGIGILDLYDRNSDERMFRDTGIPILRFTGGRNANDYPQYHGPLDTPPYVYQFAGGKANFALGYEFAFQSAYYAILGIDAFDPWTLDVASNPTS